FEMYDFLQLIIKLYFEKPNTYQSIMKWSKSKSDNEFLRYVQNRFSSYAQIREYYSLTNEDFASLESMQKDEEKIPIGDLVFYCQTLPYHLGTSPAEQKGLHPLTEFELVTILQEIKNNSEKNDSSQESGDDVDDNFLCRIKLSLSERETLRKRKGIAVETDQNNSTTGPNDSSLNSNQENKSNENTKVYKKNKCESERYAKLL